MQQPHGIALCYMQDRADLKCLHHLKARISQIQIDALSMNQESLAELLLPGHWYNPFPKFHLTERPDASGSFHFRRKYHYSCG